MTCLETQSKIVDFIEDKLSDEEIVSFVKHIKHCENCAEELEIYYTLLIGMKQLDNEEQLSTDFRKDLSDKLNHSYSRIVNTKKIKISTLLIAIVAVLMVVNVVYSNFLKLLYISEQKSIEESQPEYMYYEYFGEYICNEDTFYLLEPYTDTETDDEFAYYKKIRSYKLMEELNSTVESSEAE